MKIIPRTLLVMLAFNCSALFGNEAQIPTRQLIVNGTCDRVITQTDMPFTISSPGINCLATDVTGQITISSNDVDLDLNSHRISGGTNGVVVSSGFSRIKIRNGIIGPVTEDGIQVNSNASSVMIEDVKILNGITGINFDQVRNSMVTNCDLTTNTTGLTLDHSYKNTIKLCRAFCNVLAGYSLLSSNTNIFKDCEALSTGEGATGDATDVFGFRSFRGFGNIFERCIANNTQALTTTVQDAIAAGFALTGTEECSKIISCEAANALTSPDGIAIPYGIFLESHFLGLDNALSTTVNAGVVQELDWSPDGRFLAKVSSSGTEIVVFQFNGTDVTEVAGVVLGALVSSVTWSPDGKFLAVGGAVSAGTTVKVYSFSGTALTLVASTTALGGGTVNSVDWSPDGKFLTFGDATGSLNVSRFTGSSLISIAALATGALISSVDWSPDSTFIATGGVALAGAEINVYRFSTLTGLTLFASAVHGAPVDSVDWSPDGKFLAMGGNIVVAPPPFTDIRVFRFTGTALTQVARAFQATVFSVNWSPDGKFLATGADSAAVTEINVYRFTRTALTLVAAAAWSALTADVNSVDWSPDGSYLAVGGAVVSGPSDSLRIFNVLGFSNRNLIKNNIVYCNLGNECPAGIGISGSSLKNCIVGNTAYENVKNYEFVTNVLNEEFNTLSLNPTGIGALLNASCNELNLE